jgi:hypothetical protein
MFKTLPILFLLLCFQLLLEAQITSPVIRARFGVDGELRTNYYTGAVITGNDDWFNNGTFGTGEFVIDTTGAAAILAGYLTDASPWPKRSSSFYRTMSRPPFSTVANRLWLDAIYVRDYHGNDTTVFTAGSDKNGMSPAFWTGGIQGIPDKNDILDMMVHVRRAGPNTTDSLWMFGGISLDNVTGNRYFDFEMYQTDIYYDRPTGKFYGYGPDEGHTSWTFDAAGDIVRPGDIIFSGEFQSGTLSNIEARIWVSRADWQTVTPSSFNWGGLFDGSNSGSLYGYASINPNTSGAFYTGLGSASGAWAGPFGLVLQDNSLAYTNPAPPTMLNSRYNADQFIEFSVNLTKLGLDPVTLLGGDICGAPFNRIVVKTRSSASFTSELKDFVAPTDLFLAPRVEVLSETPIICDTGSIAEIHVVNPVSTSFYQWSTLNGNIVGATTGTSIYVDTPGVYIVTHYLQAGCSPYATDTITIDRFAQCHTLASNLYYFNGRLADGQAKLEWKVLSNQLVDYFEVERSLNGMDFTPVATIARSTLSNAVATYNFNDDISYLQGRSVSYRIKIISTAQTTSYSNVLRFTIPGTGHTDVRVLINPVRESMQIGITSIGENTVKVSLLDQSGRIVHSSKTAVTAGYNQVTIPGLSAYPRGVYIAIFTIGTETFREKIILMR